jgi:fructose-bisphosphate aldolase, class I
MFNLVHAMRTRVLTSQAFDGSRVLATILFGQTMERDVSGVPAARYLWDEKNVVPFLKIGKGAAPEQDGVQLMKPIDTLDDLLERAQRHQVFGTKMRSVINDADEAGISAIVDQQFGYASRILAAGLVPIIEPEVSISSPHKEQAETLLRDAITKHVQALPEGSTVMLKITIPARPGLACMATWRLTRASCEPSPCRAATAVTRPALGSHAIPPSSPASRARFSKG